MLAYCCRHFLLLFLGMGALPLVFCIHVFVCHQIMLLNLLEVGSVIEYQYRHTRCPPRVDLTVPRESGSNDKNGRATTG